MRAPQTRAAPGTRLPTEPYPGLRPFLDYEAALLFGRERQVREVIERLKQTQFVAVLGGSGSGKSSLIHAGVTPELRSFGIPGAGDFWVTMTCTPGTNVRAAPGAERKHTPITRLAWKFAALLRSRGSDEADAARLTEIADVFRQEGGFARLMETYVGELAVPPGPDPKDARLMFVVDQFEELFHPTNNGVDDATHLVERVIDHFFDPHPHAYVVLTMRSEHLNDCARFLELPDAINSASYLIRRLDQDELRLAIVQPAQRFLRLCARSGDAEGLPDEVQFDDKLLLPRLLHDVGDITHDPDHLPLLQHLLARLWQAARQREGNRGPVPAAVTMDDLVVAVGAGKATALDAKSNTLRDSLENWAEAAFPHDDSARARGLHALLRKLAFKDPNTGMYTQQRFDVDDSVALLGPGKTRDDVRALVADGYLGSVNYLFWDDEDPSRVTLKVSHESFIRGWRRFRRLIDDESERFGEFLGVLRKCATWAARGRPESMLLAEDDLARLREADLQKLLATPAERAAWFRMLLLDRDGPRLAPLDAEVDRYVASSVARQQRLTKAQTTSRNIRRGSFILALLIVPPAAFSVFVQAPVAKRAELMFKAGNRATSVLLPSDFPDRDTGVMAMRELIGATDDYEVARTGVDTPMTRLSERLLHSFERIPAVQRQKNLLDGLGALVEPSINDQLRVAMAAWLWPRPQPEGELLPAEDPVQRRCNLSAPGEPPTVVSGRLFTSGSELGLLARRHLFVPDAAGSGSKAVSLRVARVAADGGCSAAQSVMEIPAWLQPRLVFDPSLRYVMYTQADDASGQPTVTVHEIDWERQPDGSSTMIGRRARAVVQNPDAVAAVRAAVAADGAVVAPTWRVSGGRIFGLGGTHWQIGSMSAQRLEGHDDDGPLTPLLPAEADSACAVLGGRLPTQPDFERVTYTEGQFCFSISIGREGAGPTREVMVAVYAQPEGSSPESVARRLDRQMPAPVSTITQFARLRRAPTGWYVGRSGYYAGWLAYQIELPANKQTIQVGAPWSTCALARQAAQLVSAPMPCMQR